MGFIFLFCAQTAWKIDFGMSLMSRIYCKQIEINKNKFRPKWCPIIFKATTNPGLIGPYYNSHGKCYISQSIIWNHFSHNKKGMGKPCFIVMWMMQGDLYLVRHTNAHHLGHTESCHKDVWYSRRKSPYVFFPKPVLHFDFIKFKKRIYVQFKNIYSHINCLFNLL